MAAGIATVAEHLLLPPGLAVLLLVPGLLLLRGQRRGGGWLVTLGLAALVLPALNVVAAPLAQTLERDLRERPLATGRADAIVVLGGGRASGRHHVTGGDDVSALTFERLRFAAHLHRRTGLPLLLSGGSPGAEGRPAEAELMADALRREFRVDPRWLEGASRNTHENAFFTAQHLQGTGVERVLVVTHAMHMPRALERFEAAGLAADPAPTGFRGPDGEWRLRDFVPTVDALETSRFALREWLARAARPLRDRLPGDRPGA
ncbi:MULTISPECIES: YdcF family protein [unclassified Thioalkalivibrio]|uniref:YdcF family protein n=1 Tax=unclassified Thioalkalivibrio TaxID=2621013 RepID=UPI00037671CC|nr:MULTISPECIES: YdcF family protein [unclassified Thioalkalivibrio]